MTLLHKYAIVKQLTYFKCSYFEIYPNGRYIRRSIGIFHKPNKYTSLSYTAISDQQQPEQVVIVFRHVLAGVVSQWIALHMLFSHVHICASFASAVCTDFGVPNSGYLPSFNFRSCSRFIFSRQNFILPSLSLKTSLIAIILITCYFEPGRGGLCFYHAMVQAKSSHSDYV